MQDVEMMDYTLMTGPCGRDCFNCPVYLSKNNPQIKSFLAKRYNVPLGVISCEDCRNIEGRCLLLKSLGYSEQCKIYKCAKNKNATFCCECSDFPCDLLQPVADRASDLPHNLKVYNLCLIKKMGVNSWATTKANESFEKYFKKKLDL